MKSNVVDWKEGRVSYWSLDTLDLDTPVDAQLDELKEDLAQVEYAGSVLIDVGWYPSFSADGCFVVVVVQHGDWDEPMFKETCAEFSHLTESLVRAIGVASSS